jgi:putative hemolysin
MAIFYSILLTIVLILLNGYFSMSEMALISAKRAALRAEADEGDKKAQKALDLGEDEDKLLATIQVGITLVGFGAASAATATLAAPIQKWLESFNAPWLTAIAAGLAVIIVTLLVSYVTLVIGELVPKRIALSDAEKTSKNVSGVISALEKLFKPIVALLSVSTNAVAKLLGIKSTEDRQNFSEEELMMLVEEQDELLDEEKRMISEIMDLGDTIAREIMVPRVEVTAVEDTATVAEVINVMRETGFSRIPVFHEDIDTIRGILMFKDLIDPVMDGELDKPAVEYSRKTYFVPETKDIIPLLGEMQTQNMQLVIVLDEYGGTAGILSLEDIVEEIVGEIDDEYDKADKYLTRLSEGEWLVDGRLDVEEAREAGFPVEDSEDYETLAGWLLDEFDSMPVKGEAIEHNGWTFVVTQMRRRRIAMVRISAPKTPESSEEETEQ